MGFTYIIPSCIYYANSCKNVERNFFLLITHLCKIVKSNQYQIWCKHTQTIRSENGGEELT